MVAEWDSWHCCSDFGKSGFGYKEVALGECHGCSEIELAFELAFEMAGGRCEGDLIVRIPILMLSLSCLLVQRSV